MKLETPPTVFKYRFRVAESSSIDLVRTTPRFPCFISSGVKGRKGSGSSGSTYSANPEASSGISESAGTILINSRRPARISGQGVRRFNVLPRDGSTGSIVSNRVIFTQSNSNNHTAQAYNAV